MPNGTPEGPKDPPPPPWEAPGRAARRRVARPALDRERIVRAALELIDAEGVDALSLRRLAGDLGVAPMSVYWHVRNKAELLDLVGQAVLERIALPPAEGDWRDQLRAIHRAMLEGVERHPNAADLVLGRARYGPAGLALFERLLSILLDAGFDPQAAFDAYHVLYLFLLGHLATGRRTEAFREAQREGLAYLLSLEPDRFPSISRVAPRIGARSRQDQFDVSLDVVIEGIAASLRRA